MSCSSGMMAYSAVRGNSPVPLFIVPRRVPMTRSYFIGKVREVRSDLGLTAQRVLFWS